MLIAAGRMNNGNNTDFGGNASKSMSTYATITG
jgi:hypothetical protein